MKRICCFLCVIILSFAIVGSDMHAFAYNESESSDCLGLIETYLIGTKDCSCELKISGGTAFCKGIIITKTGYTANCTMSLQKYSNGSWTTIKKWTAIKETTSKSYSVSSGYKYRVKFSGNIYNSSGTKVDSFSATSVTETY